MRLYCAPFSNIAGGAKKNSTKELHRKTHIESKEQSFANIFMVVKQRADNFDTKLDVKSVLYKTVQIIAKIMYGRVFLHEAT